MWDMPYKQFIWADAEFVRVNECAQFGTTGPDGRSRASDR